MPNIPYSAVFHNNFDQVPGDSWRADAIRFFKEAQSVLFVADATLRATERNLATKLWNAQIIRNPVNLESTESEPWPQQETPHFACVGALDVSRKGQDLLLEALSTSTWKRRDWRLSIFGGGENRNYLTELIAYYGLTDHVQLCGEVRDVRSIWRNHHALLVASRIESAPLVIVEAMLCGRPVISTGVGGIREWVREGQNGFLCEAANAKSFGAALERAWEQRSAWQALGARAHRDALRMYDPEPAETLLSMLAGQPATRRLELKQLAAV
jgi:L-malate glycosyltransferase